MNVTTTPTGPVRANSLPLTTVVVGVAAAAVTTAAAAALDAAGVSFTVEDEKIPLAAFAQLTLIGAVAGGVLLAVLNRRSAAPRTRFLLTTVALTALSCVPSVLWPDDAGTKVALVALHLLAAIMIVPALARRART